ncbi:hypothetical protein QR680_007426 [Steinernema hermaphroditum]|uniref:Uncharacterized protein n=1 Tax=Steinernema hermaphroditum TaxID=289476 RepID=A0AA39IFM5_9BILA|nr:hypothetical protein QR680_007426 [Steinernema hermaphroditum]
MDTGSGEAMSGGDQMDPQKLQGYFDQVIKQTDFYINEERKKIEEYEALREKIKPLPEKLTHDIMVPFGSVAYLPGKLIHTNCVSVNYGDHYFVERSVHQAEGIIDRRLEVIKEKIKGYEAEKKMIKERIDFVNSLYNSDEPPEIREPYDEEEEKRKRAQRKSEKRHVSKEEFAEMMGHLDELEMLEAQEQAQQKADEKEKQPKKVQEVEVTAANGGVPEEDFLQLLDHLNALEEEGDEDEEDDEETSEGELYSDHDSDEEGDLDSDDYPESQNEQPALKVERKRSVRFNLEDQPQTSNGEPPSPSASAKPILRNKDYQSPIDHEAIEKSNQRDVKKILPESKEAFPGMVVERTPIQQPIIPHDDDPQPSTSGEPPVRMSKFKMQRMKR